MKKAKIMLMAIAVLGVVGGALAFKAQKFLGNYYCSTTKTTGAHCSSSYITEVGGATLYCTTEPITTLRSCSILYSVEPSN